MHTRSSNEDASPSHVLNAVGRVSGPAGMRSDRLGEIRQRMAEDTYRSVDVVDEIARRILRSRDL